MAKCNASEQSPPFAFFVSSAIWALVSGVCGEIGSMAVRRGLDSCMC